jgi:GNAT superfamily N-acetyltransferase
VIREAEHEDLTELLRLSAELGYTPDFPVMEDNFDRIRDDKDHMLWVFTDNRNKPLGYIEFAPYITIYKPPIVDIIGLVVSGDQRGKGIGKTLVHAVTDWARKNDYSGVRLVSNVKRKDAHRFYENLGFVNRKDQKNFQMLFRDEE